MERNWQAAGYSPEIQQEYFSLNPTARWDLLSEGGFVGCTSEIRSRDLSHAAAFSRLGLSHYFHPPTPQLSSPARMADGVGVPVADGYGFSFDEVWDNVGFPGFENYGGQNLGYYSGAHRNLMVGPESWDCGGAGAEAVSGFGGGGGVQGDPRYGNWPSLLNTQLNADNNGHVVGDNSYASLLYKQMLSSRINAQFQGSPSNQNGVSRRNLGCSSVNGSVWKNSYASTRNSQRNRQLYDRNKNPFGGISLQDMRGMLVSISKDQNGSKILQGKLDGLNDEEIELVLCEVMDYIADLMRNQYGRYVVQKLFGVCSEEQRTRIIMAITKNSSQLVDVCLNHHGAVTMQKLLENLSTPEQISLVISALCPRGVALANDPNGQAQHVIRYCLISYPYEYHKYLLNEIANNCCRIATDKSGCCFLQECVEHIHGETKKRLIHEIIANALTLAKDPYGNYVVQHLLGLKMPQVTASLVARLQGHFVALSSDKYGSNVVEKFFTEAGKEYYVNIIMEIISSPKAASLLMHPYGNFVIQAALSIAKGSDVYLALCNLIKMNASSMRSNLFGKKILAWFESRRRQDVL